MKIVEFDGYYNRVGICADKITGFCISGKDPDMVFICTGPDGQDGAENGWSVKNTYAEVKAILEDA